MSKLLFFYRANGGLETYKNQNEPHPNTVCLYLHDNHYYMILNLTAFIGTPYVCQFCFKGYSKASNHSCEYVCNVCFDPDCYKHPKRIVHCTDSLCYCKSRYCYNMHKKIPPGHEKIPCDVIKYCELCNRRYEITGCTKPHQYATAHCAHCHEELPVQGKHRCFIQPKAPRTPSEKYIYYDFETRYETVSTSLISSARSPFKAKNLWRKVPTV